MSRWRILALACLASLPTSFLLARVHPLGDAGLYAGNASAPFMDDAHVPPNVRLILAAKCADCHSAQARAPLYGRFAPMSWLMESDIVRGRQAMNLTRWSSYSEDQRANLTEEIAAVTRRGEMPLLQYRLIHWRSRISSSDISALAHWANQQSTSVVIPGGQAGPTDDVARGHQLFSKRCGGCHSLTQDGEGPRLGGVFGRTSGTVPSYQYSAALKKAHIVWNDTTLEKWLTSPDQMVPGTEMDFYVPKPEERQEIIRYLKSAM